MNGLPGGGDGGPGLADVAVVGGGMAGLAAADALVAAGRQVVLLEAERQLGGLARSLSIAGEPIEAYGHHVCHEDHEIRALVRRLGLEPNLEWLPASTAIVRDGRVHRVGRTLDTLRFGALSPAGRIRLGLGTSFVLLWRHGRRVDKRRVADLGPLWFGRPGYDAVWRPQLEGWFGDLAPDVTSSRLLARMRRSSRSGRFPGGNRVGCLRGSLGVLFDRWAEDLIRRGVRIDLGARVARIDRLADAWRLEAGSRPVDAASVVACVSGRLLGEMTDLPDEYRRTAASIPYRSAVGVLLELDRPLGRHYRVDVADPSEFGCVTVIEHTAAVDPARYGGRHLVFLEHYTEFDGPAWNASPEALVAAAEPILRCLNPAFDRAWISDVTVSRDRDAQPVPLVGGPMPALGFETGLPGFFHASLAHIYPDDPSLSLAVRLGGGVAAAADTWLATEGPIFRPRQVTIGRLVTARFSRDSQSTTTRW